MIATKKLEARPAAPPSEARRGPKAYALAIGNRETPNAHTVMAQSASEVVKPDRFGWGSFLFYPLVGRSARCSLYPGHLILAATLLALHQAGFGQWR